VPCGDGQICIQLQRYVNESASAGGSSVFGPSDPQAAFSPLPDRGAARPVAPDNERDPLLRSEQPRYTEDGEGYESGSSIVRRFGRGDPNISVGSLGSLNDISDSSVLSVPPSR
jgi:hypothetical protein